MARQIPELRRRTGARLPKQKFYLFCEGKNTEPEYFEELNRLCRGALIEVASERAVGDPGRIAEVAIDAARKLGLIGRRRARLPSFELKDEVWAVFDRDEHERFFNAVRRCEDQGIRVARSNPCFEVWLILHEEDFNRPDERHEVQRHVRHLYPEYDPNGRKSLDYKPLMSKIKEAEDRAKRQLDNRKAEGQEYGSPSTTVGCLTKRIRTAAKLTP